MAHVNFESSSRKNRDLPFSPAFRWAGAALWKKVSDGQIFMQHNMGLCCMNEAKGRGGVGHFFFFARTPGSVPEKF